MTLRSHSTAAALALLLAAPFARAQESAEPLLRRGIELRTQGQDEQALAVFQQAYSLAHSPVSAAQLGLCEQSLGRWLDAERHLREALAAASDGWVGRNRAALDAAWLVNAQHVGSLELRGGVPGAEVLLDGAPAGSLPLAEPLRALVGTVTLEVRAAGYYDLSRRVPIAPGVTRETVELRPRAPEPVVAAVVPEPVVAPPVSALVVAPARPAPSRVGPALRTAGWVGFGVGLASGATAVISLAVRESSAHDYNTTCYSNSTDARCSNLRGLDGPLLVTAVTTAVVGAVLLTGWGLSRLAPSGEAPAARALRCAPGLGSVACALRF